MSADKEPQKRARLVTPVRMNCQKTMVRFLLFSEKYSFKVKDQMIRYFQEKSMFLPDNTKVFITRHNNRFLRGSKREKRFTTTLTKRLLRGIFSVAL